MPDSSSNCNSSTRWETSEVQELMKCGLDADGHLMDAQQWTKSLALAMAKQDELVLTDDHWWMIRFVRDHHERYDMPPLMRVVIKALREQSGHADASSRSLYRLFPEGPIRLACRYAGLPKPESCI